MMPFIGTAGYPPGSRGPSDALRRLSAASLDAMEVQFVRQVSMSLERAEALGNEAAAAGVRLSAHAPYYVNFNSANVETRDRSVMWVLESLRRAQAMGASVVVVHAASYGKEQENATARVEEGLLRVRERMDDEGIRTAIGLETMGKKGSWGTLDEIASVAASVEGTVPVLDFAHIHARSAGGLRSADDFAEIIAECRSISGEDPHCHVSGVEYGDKGERKHLPLDSKEPDYGLLAEASVHLGEDAVLIVESPRPLDDAVLLRGMLQG